MHVIYLCIFRFSSISPMVYTNNMTHFLMYLMFHKGQGALGVWIQLGKMEREVTTPEKIHARPHRTLQSTGRL